MFCVTGINRHDSVVFDELINTLLAAAVKRGKPGKLHADKEYDYARCRRHIKRRSIKDHINCKGIKRNDRLDRHRWVFGTRLDGPL